VLPLADDGKSNVRETRDDREVLVNAHDEAEEPRREPDEVDPAEAVPEADSAEQYADTAEETGQEDWLEHAAGLPFAEGSEGDVVEQAMEAGDEEDDEYR